MQYFGILERYIFRRFSIFAFILCSSKRGNQASCMGRPDSKAIKNGHLRMYRFDGGYVSFSNDTIDGWHYYIQDYMGNNRMVANKTGTVEQVTHYYPYGGVIGDISTNENLQAYKFEGKELDRTFGLDNYDIHARQYFAMAPMWDRIDPMAEKYYGISPYVYCWGDPVNKFDWDGKDIFEVTQFGHVVNRTTSQGTYLKFKNNQGNIYNEVQLSSDNSYDETMGILYTQYLDYSNSKNKSKDLVYAFTTSEIALNVQNVMTENTEVEWKAIVTEDGKGLLVSNHAENHVDSYNTERNLGIDSSKNRIEIHGHPGRNAADGSTSEGTRGGSRGDVYKMKHKPSTYLRI